MIKYISNIPEIREKLKTKELPEAFTLSIAEEIIDVAKFIDSNLSILSVDKLKRIHRPYFDRLKKVLDTLKIIIIIIEEK